MKTENAKSPEKRDETVEKPVTELAHVDAHTTDKEAKDISGFTDEKHSSTQQKDAYEGVKHDRERAKHPEKDAHPHHIQHGPGVDIA